MKNWFNSELSPFSVPDRPSECGSHRDCDRRRVRKCPPADDLREAPPVPAAGLKRKHEAEAVCVC